MKRRYRVAILIGLVLSIQGRALAQGVPSLSVGDSRVVEGNADLRNAAFTVTLSGATDKTVEVAWATADGTATAGSDYVAASDTLSFAPGETTKTIWVPVVGDTIFDPGETFYVNLLSATNATIAVSRGVGTIVDDDAPSGCTYAFSPARQNVAAAGGQGAITVTPSGADCQWFAASDSAWITITSGASGTGLGTALFSVSANSGAAREAWVYIANQTFTLRQLAKSDAGSLLARYRLYSPVTLEHLFTTDANEYTVLGWWSGVWQQEGVSHQLYSGPLRIDGVDAVPYYRLYDKTRRWHHWTTDLNEYLVLSQYPMIYTAEGIDGYVFSSQVTGSVPLYRLLYSGITGLHHWTTDTIEVSVLATRGWIVESQDYVWPPN